MERKLSHIKKFNESGLRDHYSFDKKVRVKDLIEYLQSFDPEAEVHLDRDGWQYGNTALEKIEMSGIFEPYTGANGEKSLFINN